MPRGCPSQGILTDYTADGKKPFILRSGSTHCVMQCVQPTASRPVNPRIILNILNPDGWDFSPSRH